MQQEHQPSYGTSYALIVGINSYHDPRFVPLGQAEKDASEVAELLSAPPYNFQISLLLGQQATRQAILAELHKLRRTKPDDRIVVYFAGHGYTLTDLYQHETGYLAAADTIPDQDYTALEMDEVTGLIKNAHAKHIGFIFDACFSGQALGLTRAPAIAAEKYLLRKAFQVLSAGAGDQTVSDFRSMTRTMLEALKSGEISRDGLVTFSELGLHVQQLIAADSGQTQIPQFGHLRGSQGGDFIFYREDGVRLPPTLVDALHSEMPNTRRGAVADLIELTRSSDESLAELATQRLTRIAREDPNERVRAAAQKFFELGAVGYDSAADLKIKAVVPHKPVVPESAPPRWLSPIVRLMDKLPVETLALGGLGLGLLVSAVMFYPLYLGLPSQVVLDAPRASLLISALLVILSAALIIGVCSLLVSRAGNSGTGRGIWQGALLGMLAAIVCYMLLGASTAGVMANGEILLNGINPALSDDHSMQLLTKAVSQDIRDTVMAFWGAAVMGALLGGLGGMLARGSKSPLVSPQPNRVRLHVIPALLGLISSAVATIGGIATYSLTASTLNENFAEFHVNTAITGESILSWVEGSIEMIFLIVLIWLVAPILWSGIRSEDSTELREWVGASRLVGLIMIPIGVLMLIIRSVAWYSLYNIIAGLLIGLGVILLVISFLFIRRARQLEAAEPTVSIVAQKEQGIQIGDLLLYGLVYVVGLILIGMLYYALASVWVAIIGLPLLLALPFLYEEWLTVRASAKANAVKRFVESVGHLGMKTAAAMWIPVFLIIAPAINVTVITIAIIPVLVDVNQETNAVQEFDFTTAELANALFSAHARIAVTGFLLALLFGIFLALMLSAVWRFLTPRARKKSSESVWKYG